MVVETDKCIVSRHTWKKKYPLLKKYFNAYTKVISNNFPRFFYIDGFAGSGSCVDKNSGQEVDGSPLISLKVKYPFTDYIFVESKKKREVVLERVVKKYSNLKARCTKNNNNKRGTEINVNIDVIHGDINREIDKILSEIPRNTPCFIFLDPEGLELEWPTVGKCSKKERIELLINFSISGVLRNLQNPRTIEKFFGKKNITEKPISKLPMTYLVLYSDLLKQYFKWVIPKPVKISSGNLLYYLIFATNNKTGYKIMKNVMKIKGIQTKLKEIMRI